MGGLGGRGLNYMSKGERTTVAARTAQSAAKTIMSSYESDGTDNVRRPQTDSVMQLQQSGRQMSPLKCFELNGEPKKSGWTVPYNV